MMIPTAVLEEMFRQILFDPARAWKAGEETAHSVREGIKQLYDEVIDYINGKPEPAEPPLSAQAVCSELLRLILLQASGDPVALATMPPEQAKKNFAEALEARRIAAGEALVHIVG